MRLAPIVLVIALLPAVIPAQDTTQLARTGQQAAAKGEYTTAVYFLKQVVAAEPRHPTAWRSLCRAYFELDQLDAAIDACLKQIDVNPQNAGVYGQLGRALWRKGKRDEAISAFSQQIEVDPRNNTTRAELGHYYCELGKYTEALPELERLATAGRNITRGQEDLGDAYLALGQIDKGLAILNQLAQDRPDPATLSSVAYRLASHRVRLDLAQRYAETAVTTTATTLVASAEEPPSVAALRQVVLLATHWDTLGWVHFQAGHLDEADKFIGAAWSVNPIDRIADHMRQLYERRGQKQQPVTIAAGRLLPGKAAADFYVVQAQKPAVPDAQFIRGDERLRPFTKNVQDLTPAGIFPEAIPPKVLRRVTLTCPGQGGDCSLELLSAAAAVYAELNAAPVNTHLAVESLRDKSGAYRIGGDVTAPVPIYRPEPEYSEQARKAKIQGTVILHLEVDPTGHTRNIEMVRGLGMGLDEKAIEAVSKWEFRPGMKDGQPVAVAVTVEVNFRLLLRPGQ
ncbi:MAG: TonB family protein [Bryobacteraceae bacterium]